MRIQSCTHRFSRLHQFPVPIFLLTLLFFVGCKKESDKTTEVNKDYTAFLGSRTFMFGGNLGDSSVLWRYGVYEFQRGNSAPPFGNNEQPDKSLLFWLTSSNDYTTRFEINTPVYSSGSDELFTKLLAPGEKELGTLYQQFELRLTFGNKKTYTTSGNQANSHLTVLKMEKSHDEFNREMVLVWFSVDCKFYNAGDNSSFAVKDGLILAGFMYNL